MMPRRGGWERHMRQSFSDLGSCAGACDCERNGARVERRKDEINAAHCRFIPDLQPWRIGNRRVNESIGSRRFKNKLLEARIERRHIVLAEVSSQHSLACEGGMKKSAKKTVKRIGKKLGKKLTKKSAAKVGKGAGIAAGVAAAGYAVKKLMDKKKANNRNAAKPAASKTAPKAGAKKAGTKRATSRKA